MSADACHKSLRALKAIYRVCSASCCNDSVTISGSSIGKWMSWSCRSSSGIGSTMPAVARHGVRESDCSRRAPWWPRLVAQRALRADASCPPGWACSRDSTPAGASPRSKATPRLTHLWVGLVVESQQVVPAEIQSGGWRLTCQAGMRTMPVVAVQPAWQGGDPLV